MNDVDTDVARRGLQRLRWMDEGRRAIERLHAELDQQGVAPSEVALVLVARGGLLLLPAVAALFPQSCWTVATCDRHTGLVHMMPLPQQVIRLVVIVDAVVASGSTVDTVLGHVASHLPGVPCWSASISCTDEAVQRLHGRTERNIAVLRDTLSNGVPTGDMDGLDAGDLFQGFDTAAVPNAGSRFARMAAVSAVDRGRREHIHAAVADVIDGLGGRRLLDLGCGDGVLTARLAQSVEYVLGYDPDAVAIAQAESHWNAQRVAFTSSLARLRLEPPFDLVTATMVLNATADAASLAALGAARAAGGGFQVWTVLHPAFSFDESLNQARHAIENGSDAFEARVGCGYLQPHGYTKTRAGVVIEQHHRPLSWYVELFGRCGLELVRLVEPPAGDAAWPTLPRVCLFITRKAAA